MKSILEIIISSPIRERTSEEETVEDWLEYTRDIEIRSCDKGGHKLRSEANQPNHIKHWNKIIKRDNTYQNT